MTSAQDMTALLRAEPFTSFRVHGIDGQAWDVRAPRTALVLRNHVVLPVWGDDPVIPDRGVVVPLDSIVRVEIPTTPAGVHA